MTTTEPRYAYRLAEVAELTGVALGALEDGCRNGTVRHRKHGRSRVMTPDDIQTYLEQIVVQPTDPEPNREEQHRDKIARRFARRSRVAA